MAKLIGGLITKPDKWTKGALGRTKEGRAVQNFDVLFTSNPWTGESEERDFAEGVKAFSLHGALVHCYDIDRREQICDKLRKAIIQYTGKSLHVAEFNNLPETTFKDVQTVVRIANV